MASGRASRRRRAAEQARAPIPRNGGTHVDRRVWVAAAVAAAVAVAVVAGFASMRGGAATALSESSTLPDAKAATSMFDGIPQQGVVLGRPDAPVTLVEFVDLQCPYCREFEVEALPTLLEEHVRPGTLRIEVRGLAFIGPDSERGLRTVLAAGRQNRLFEVKELLYFNQGAENSGWLSQDLAEAAARSVPGLDVGRLAEDMGSGGVADIVDAHADEAERRGVNSTPTIFVGRTGGALRPVELASASDVESIERAISAAAK